MKLAISVLLAIALLASFAAPAEAPHESNQKKAANLFQHDRESGNKDSHNKNDDEIVAVEEEAGEKLKKARNLFQRALVAAAAAAPVQRALVAAAPAAPVSPPNSVTLLQGRLPKRWGSVQLAGTLGKGRFGVVRQGTLTLRSEAPGGTDVSSEVAVKYSLTAAAEGWLADECLIARQIWSGLIAGRAHAFSLDGPPVSGHSSRVANCVTLVSGRESTAEVIALAMPTHGQKIGMLGFINLEEAHVRRREMYIMEPALMTMGDFLSVSLPYQSADVQAGAVLELIRCTFQAVQAQFDSKVSHNDVHPRNVLLYGDSLWRASATTGINGYPPSACRFCDYGAATPHGEATMYGSPSHLDFGRVCAHPDDVPPLRERDSWSEAEVNTWENKGKEMTAAAMLMASALLIHDCTPNADVLSRFTLTQVADQVRQMYNNKGFVEIGSLTRAAWTELDKKHVSNRLLAAFIWQSCEDNPRIGDPNLVHPPFSRALKLNAELGVRLTTAVLDMLRPSTRDCQKSPIEVLTEIEKLFVPDQRYKGGPTEDEDTLRGIVQEETSKRSRRGTSEVASKPDSEHVTGKSPLRLHLPPIFGE